MSVYARNRIPEPHAGVACSCFWSSSQRTPCALWASATVVCEHGKRHVHARVDSWLAPNGAYSLDIPAPRLPRTPATLFAALDPVIMVPVSEATHDKSCNTTSSHPGGEPASRTVDGGWTTNLRHRPAAAFPCEHMCRHRWVGTLVVSPLKPAAHRTIYDARRTHRQRTRAQHVAPPSQLGPTWAPTRAETCSRRECTAHRSRSGQRLPQTTKSRWHTRHAS